MKALLLCCFLAVGAWGKPAGKSPAASECRACHTSDDPTREHPALAPCPRLTLKGDHSVSEGPVTIVLDDISNKYGAVRFSHKKHAEMAEMGDGCYGCHHYNHARPIFSCKECHSASRVRTDLSKPDLKGARHRQCVDCHLEWSRGVDCDSCHEKRDGGAAAVPEKHPFPKSEVPDRVVYETHSVKGKTVTFFHSDHAKRFGLQCVDCHRDQACAGCHAPDRLAARARSPVPSQPKTGSMDELHRTCFPCHVDDDCGRCHRDRPTAAFDHGKSAGWKLNRPHAGLDCRKCHKAAGKFAKVDKGCESCHPDWRKAFEHRKTGFALNETHGGLDCDGCHGDASFASPPTCAGCHPDKSFPKDKPGRPL